MGYQNIYQTFGGSAFMPPATINNLTAFLLSNRAYIWSPEKKSEAFRTRFFGHTILSDTIMRITGLGLDTNFALLKLPSKSVSLHEAVDMTFLPMDLLQMKAVIGHEDQALALVPELHDKVVINVTDLTKANGDFVDVTRFHQRVVRDFLSRNYATSTTNMWVSTSLVRYVAKVYSMTIGQRLARFFGLSPDVQLFVQTVFCAFFLGQMTTSNVTEGFMKSNAKQLGLPQGFDLQQILDMMKDTLGHAIPTTLEKVFAVIDGFDHDQLKNKGVSRLNRGVLNAQFASLGAERVLSTIALEYPPYFLYLIMLVLSNERIGLAFYMKNMKIVNEGREVVEQMIKSPMFLHA